MTTNPSATYRPTFMSTYVSEPVMGLIPVDILSPEELELPPECIPDVEKLIIDDGAAVGNIYAEKQQRLLTETLYSSWPGPGEGRPFVALANVGLFYMETKPALVPDVMVSLDVYPGEDLRRKENRSYLMWMVGKAPNIVVELVSDKRGKEDTRKMVDYATIGVPFYILFDPLRRLGGEILEAYGLCAGIYETSELKWMPSLGLGLTLWEGEYEGQRELWLRWCDAQGQLIPTGKERADAADERADAADERAARLAAKLRELGIDPDA